jgi:hypothetical protein
VRIGEPRRKCREARAIDGRPGQRELVEGARRLLQAVQNAPLRARSRMGGWLCSSFSSLALRYTEVVRLVMRVPPATCGDLRSLRVFALRLWRLDDQRLLRGGRLVGDERIGACCCAALNMLQQCGMAHAEGQEL